jgi:hypothetical protein
MGLIAVFGWPSMSNFPRSSMTRPDGLGVFNASQLFGSAAENHCRRILLYVQCCTVCLTVYTSIGGLHLLLIVALSNKVSFAGGA